MIKLSKPESVRKAFSTIVLGTGLITTTVFANAESNYSFGGSSGGGIRNCFEQNSSPCLSVSLGSLCFGNNCPPGPTFGISYTGQHLTCKPKEIGSSVCSSQSCTTGAVSSVSNSNCK